MFFRLVSYKKQVKEVFYLQNKTYEVRTSVTFIIRDIQVFSIYRTNIQVFQLIALHNGCIDHEDILALF